MIIIKVNQPDNRCHQYVVKLTSLGGLIRPTLVGVKHEMAVFFRSNMLIC